MIMDPALTDGADLMDWGFTSILPADTSPNLPSLPPTAEYSAIDWSALEGLAMAMPAYESLTFNLITIPLDSGFIFSVADSVLVCRREQLLL